MWHRVNADRLRALSADRAPTPQNTQVVIYHYGESWRRSGNTHPRAQKTL